MPHFIYNPLMKEEEHILNHLIHVILKNVVDNVDDFLKGSGFVLLMS